jgi:hypothetical protein
MPAATAGRLIAAVGLVTAFLAIWVDALSTAGFSVSYWDVDDGLGGVLLAFACVGALLAIAALVVRAPALDLALGAVGAVLFGMYLFFPAALAFADWDSLTSGAWLGVCSGLIVIGAGLALTGWGTEISPPAPLPVAISAVGWGLVVAGIWFDVQKEGGSYWHPEESGHGLGVLFLILLGLWLVAGFFGAQPQTAFFGLSAALVACSIFGLAFFVPVLSAFDELDNLRAGGWLPLAGGFLLAVGSLLALGRPPLAVAPAREPAAPPAPAPPATPAA